MNQHLSTAPVQHLKARAHGRLLLARERDRRLGGTAGTGFSARLAGLGGCTSASARAVVEPHSAAIHSARSTSAGEPAAR